MKTKITLAVFAALPAIGQIPVNCGDTLNTPGGLYVLTGNLTCPSVPALHIVADGVQLDMQGFALSKSGAAVGAAIITAAGPTCVVTNGISVHHGTISGFGTGISLCVPTSPGVTSATTNAEFHHMTLTGNSTGIALFNADGNLIHHNSVNSNNGTAGLTPGTGIALASSGSNQIYQNEVKSNNVNGIVLIVASSNNLLTHNDVAANNANGILVALNSDSNVMKHNGALADGAFDLTDLNPNCGSNLWSMNVFTNASKSCIH